MSLPTFSTLPDDLLIQILTLVEQDNPRTLHNLLFIRSAKAVAERLIYRKVTFRGPRAGWSSAWPPYKLLLERLSDNQNHLGTLVRDLTIVDWPGPESREFGSRELETLVRNLKNPVVLRWENSKPIPLPVASSFHNLFPSALLSVRTRKRGAAAPWGYHWNAAVDLDIRLSRQNPLCLEFVAIQNGSDFPIGASPNCSKEITEFPVFKNILRRGQKVRVLVAGCFTGGSYMIGRIYQKVDSNQDEDKDDCPFYKNPRSEDSFPILGELASLTRNCNPLHPPGFKLSKAQCIAWKTAWNWRSLVELDLWNARLNDFFVIFRGWIPQLQTLKVRVSLEAEEENDPAPLIREMGRFLDGIKGLENLVVEDCTRILFPGICPSIARHGHSLRSLDVNPTERMSHYLPGWSEEALKSLSEPLPRLNKLDIAIDLIKSPGYWSPGVLAWSNNPFSLLSSFPIIESLKIRIRLPHTNRNLAPIDHDGVLKLATDTYQAFHKQNEECRLEMVEVRVERSSDTFFEPCNSVVIARVRRLGKDGVRGQLRGCFETEVGVGADIS